MTSMASTRDPSVNPFSASDPDRREIWEMLMTHDFEAFVAGDWSAVEDDLWEEGFCGIDAQKQPDPSRWVLAYPNVTSYRDEWLRQVREFAPVQLEGTTILEFLYQSCRLDEIEVKGNRAIGCKKFSGVAKALNGEEIHLRFQSLYKLIRPKNRWMISGFVGYLPIPPPSHDEKATAATPWSSD